MSTEEGRSSTPASSGVIDETGHGGSRRMSHFKEYKFFRSFSAKVENWPMRKAEALWRRMRERKIAGEIRAINSSKFLFLNPTFLYVVLLITMEISPSLHFFLATNERDYNLRIKTGSEKIVKCFDKNIVITGVEFRSRKWINFFILPVIFPLLLRNY